MNVNVHSKKCYYETCTTVRCQHFILLTLIAVVPLSPPHFTFSAFSPQSPILQIKVNVITNENGTQLFHHTGCALSSVETNNN